MRLDNIIRIAAFIITCLIVAATWNVKRKNGTGAHIKQEQETTKTAPDQHRLNPAHNTAHSGFSLMPQKSEQVRLSPIAQPQPKVLTSSTTAQDATARDSSQKSPRVSLPPFSSDVGRIMHLLHVTPEMIARDSARFRQDTRYVEWMERIDSVLGDSLGKEMKDVLGADQQEVLYFHELLSNAYLEGTISHDDLMRYLGDVLKNSQTLYMLYLTDSQYSNVIYLAHPRKPIRCDYMA